MNEPKPGTEMDTIIPISKQIYSLQVPENGMSPEIGHLAKALSKAQSQMESVTKGVENTFFHSKYADINAYIQTAKKPLADNGLSITQLVSNSQTGVPEITTMLLHESGQYITSCLSLSPTANTPQGMGSAITYARRYALAAILNMGAEDDDANDASKQTKTTTATKSVGVATPKQIQLVAMLLKKKGRTNEALYRKFGIDSLTKMSFEQASSAIDGLSKMPDLEVKVEDVSQEPPIDPPGDNLTDAEIEEIDKGIAEMAKEDKGLAADNFEVAWVKAHLTKLMKNKIISPEQVDMGLSMLTHQEVIDLKAKYQEMDLDNE
jgi:hypothetical protein